MSKRRLEIDIIVDERGSTRGFTRMGREVDTLESRMRRMGATGARVLGGAVVAGAVAAAYGIKKSVDEAREANKVGAQTGAVIKSTGGAAKVTEKQVASLAGAVSLKAGIDDEAVQSGANLLLTFTNIRNEAGKGNDVFNQSTETIVDMSAALDQDLKSSAIQVGKALNDPIKGLTALQRVGVSFSEQKAEQIKQWVEEGETLRAQKAILAELNKEFGGSAEAQADSFDKLKVGIENAEEQIGQIFIPILSDAADEITEEFMPRVERAGGALSQIFDRKDLTFEGKLKRAGKVVEREFGDIPPKIADAIEDAAPLVAERAGAIGLALAKGTIDGFINANPLGKAAILLWASKAFGGPAAVLGAGKAMGSRFGGAAATESAAAMAAGFGLSKGGTKALTMIDRARSAGKTVGKLGLGLGVLEGMQAVFQDPASGLQDRLEQLSAWGSGMMGTIERASGLSDAFDALGIDNWAGQGDRATRLMEVLGQINTVHGRQNQLLVAEARTLADQLHLTRQQRKEVEATAQVQTIAGQSLQAGIRGLEAGKFTRMGDIQSVLSQNNQAIATKFAEGSKQARDAMAENFRAAADAIKTGMDRGVISTKQGMAEIARLTRNAHLVSGDDPFGIARGFQRSWERAGTVTDQSLDQIQRSLSRMPPASAQVTGQMMISMAREMRQKGQLSKGEMEKIRSAVVTKLSLMASQGGKKATLLQSNVSGAFGDLNTDVGLALGSIIENTNNALRALGAKGAIERFAVKNPGFVYDTSVTPNQAGKKGDRARGGPVSRVPGQGLHDTVDLAVNGVVAARVAPGEDLVVLNRHQRPLVDAALANEYGVAGLGGFFNAFDRPHYMARGGMVEPQITGPEPLRSGAQAATHRAFEAAEAYIRAHRPKGGSDFKGASGRYPGVSGDTDFVPALGQALSRMARSSGTSIYVSSGWRSYEEQAHLYQLYQEGKGNLAAPPGSSNHEDGRAADISPGQEVFGGLAGKFGLGFTVPGESWHIELLRRGGIVDAAGGGIIKGRVSYFGGGATAGGGNTSQPGLALNLNPGTDSGWNNPTTQGWMEKARAGHPVYGRTTIAGHTANLPIIDLGPSGFTGRAIDVTEGGVRKLGLDTANFPTDSIGTVEILGTGKSAGGKRKGPRAHPGRTRKGGGTEGPGGKRRKGEKDPREVISLPGTPASDVPEILRGLSPGITSLFTGPSMSAEQRFAASDLGLQVAGETATLDDDQALYKWQLGASQKRKQAIQKEIRRLNKRLEDRLTNVQRKKIIEKREALEGELGSVQGRITSAREGLDGLGEEEGDSALQEAMERQTEEIEKARQAEEEHTAAIKGLEEELKLNRHIAESEAGISATVARTALADIISGQLGPRASHMANTAGAGTVGRR